MISGPSSYLGTIDDFLSRWSAVNADAAAAPGLVTRDGKTRESLITLRGLLDTALGNVEDRLNDKEIARATLENTKRNILGRAQELVRRLRIRPIWPRCRICRSKARRRRCSCGRCGIATKSGSAPPRRGWNSC